MRDFWARIQMVGNWETVQGPSKVEIEPLIDMGAALFLKGKLELLPHRTHNIDQVRALFDLDQEPDDAA